MAPLSEPVTMRVSSWDRLWICSGRVCVAAKARISATSAALSKPRWAATAVFDAVVGVALRRCNGCVEMAVFAG